MKTKIVKVCPCFVAVILLTLASAATLSSAQEQAKKKTVKIGFAKSVETQKEPAIENKTAPSFLDFNPSLETQKPHRPVSHEPKIKYDYRKKHATPIKPNVDYAQPPYLDKYYTNPRAKTTPVAPAKPKTYKIKKAKPRKKIKRSARQSKPNYDKLRNDESVTIFGNIMFLISGSILGGMLIIEFIDKTTRIKREAKQKAKAYKKELKKWRKELDEQIAEIQISQQNVIWDDLCEDLKLQACDLKKSPEYHSAAIKARIGKYVLSVMKFAFAALLVFLIYLCLPSNCIWLYNALGSALLGIAIELVVGGWLIALCIALLCATIFRVNDLALQVTLPNKHKTLLAEVVNSLAKHLKVRPPKQITLSPFAEAYVCFKRKWLRKYSELNIGLPLMRKMSPRFFLAVLAHELIHLKQVKTLGIAVEKNVEADKTIEAINRAYWVMGQMTRLSRTISGLVIYPAISILKASVLARLYFARRLGRFLEFHADSASGLFIDPAELEPSLANIGKLSMVAQITFNQINETFLIDQLPDNLPKLILNNYKKLPEATDKVFVKQQHDQKTKWYYTHPTDQERAEYFAESLYRPDKLTYCDIKLADCTSLLGEFETFEKLTTSAYYQNNLGTDYKKEHLTPTDSLIKRFEGRFSAMWALHRLLGRWVLPLMPLRLPKTSEQAAIFDGTYKKILDYRKWRHDNSEMCIETVEKLYADYEKWPHVGLVEFLNSWDPDFAARIFKGPLIYTTKLAKKAVSLRKDISTKTDYLFDQQELAGQYFLAAKTLLQNYPDKLNAAKTTFSLAELTDKFTKNFNSITTMQTLDPMIQLIHKKIYYIENVYSLASSINIDNISNVSYKSRQYALREFYFFCNGRFNRLVLLMADITRKLETLDGLPDQQAVMNKLAPLKNIYLSNLEDYDKPIMDDVNWFLGWWYAARTSMFGQLALYSLEVEKTLDLDSSLELMVSPKIMDKLAYNIV